MPHHTRASSSKEAKDLADALEAKLTRKKRKCLVDNKKTFNQESSSPKPAMLDKVKVKSKNGKSRSKIQKPLRYACSVESCSKKFAFITNLRSHLRTHTQSKPFKCTFPNCDFKSPIKSTVFSHVHSIHFKVSQKKQKFLTDEKKKRAEKYIAVNMEALDKEEDEIARVRIGSKRNKRQIVIETQIKTELDED